MAQIFPSWVYWAIVEQDKNIMRSLYVFRLKIRQCLYRHDYHRRILSDKNTMIILKSTKGLGMGMIIRILRDSVKVSRRQLRTLNCRNLRFSSAMLRQNTKGNEKSRYHAEHCRRSTVKY
ncbi:MAG: hypothetical protein ACLRWA_06360 [Lachnospira sp.]